MLQHRVCKMKISIYTIIPKKVKAWRRKQPKFAIMKTTTFKNIVKAAMKKGISKESAQKIAGKAYWKAVKAKFKKR